jgi:hypothetical protein
MTHPNQKAVRRSSRARADAAEGGAWIAVDAAAGAGVGGQEDVGEGSRWARKDAGEPPHGASFDDEDGRGDDCAMHMRAHKMIYIPVRVPSFSLLNSSLLSCTFVLRDDALVQPPSLRPPGLTACISYLAMCDPLLYSTSTRPHAAFRHQL